MSTTENLPAATGEASAKGYPLGIDPVRILRVLQQRLILVVGAAIVFGAIAYAAGAIFSKPVYRAQGTLQHNALPIPEALKQLYTPPKFEDRLARVNERENMEALVAKFQLGIEPGIMARLFKVEQPVNTEQVAITLDWEQPDQGSAMVNYLMDTFVERIVDERVRRIQDIAKDNRQALKECTERLAARRAEYDEFLKKGKIEDPKGEKDRLDKEHDGQNALVKSTQQTLDITESQIVTTKATIAELKRKVANKEPLPDAVQTAHTQRLRELKAKLRDGEQKLEETKLELKGVKSKLEVVKKLVRDKAAPLEELKETEKQAGIVQSRHDALVASVKLVQEETREEEKNPARSYIEKYEVKLEDFEAARAGLVKQLKEAAAKRDDMRAETNRLTKLLKDSEDLEKGVTGEKDRRNQLEAQIVALRSLSGRDVKEFTVNTPAKAARFPFGSDAKRIMVLTFAAPMGLVLALIIGLAMVTDNWKGETLAGKLKLPVLARARLVPSPDKPGQKIRKLSQEDVRGLALRLRQYVSDVGGMLLFSSTSAGEEVDELVGDLSRFLAMRDEKVLIIDVRIANAELAGLTKLVERPVEVAAGDGQEPVDDGDPCQAGLVQYLVFEGQNPEDFIHPTLTRDVYVMPAGGPHSMTDSLASEPMKDLLERLRKKYSVIMLVGPSAAHTTDTEILAAYVNGIIVIINGEAASFGPAASVFQSLKEANAPLVGSVLCV